MMKSLKTLVEMFIVRMKFTMDLLKVVYLVHYCFCFMLMTCHSVSSQSQHVFCLLMILLCDEVQNLWKGSEHYVHFHSVGGLFLHSSPLRK
jgi:hypothetical protein